MWGVMENFLSWEMFDHVVLVMGIFLECDFGHEKFFGHVILVMGNFLDM